MSSSVEYVTFPFTKTTRDVDGADLYSIMLRFQSHESDTKDINKSIDKWKRQIYGTIIDTSEGKRLSIHFRMNEGWQHDDFLYNHIPDKDTNTTVKITFLSTYEPQPTLDMCPIKFEIC